jgi:hypothetical protein
LISPLERPAGGSGVKAFPSTDLLHGIYGAHLRLAESEAVDFIRANRGAAGARTEKGLGKLVKRFRLQAGKPMKIELSKLIHPHARLRAIEAGGLVEEDASKAEAFLDEQFHRITVLREEGKTPEQINADVGLIRNLQYASDSFGTGPSWNPGEGGLLARLSRRFRQRVLGGVKPVSIGQATTNKLLERYEAECNNLVKAFNKYSSEQGFYGRIQNTMRSAYFG